MPPKGKTGPLYSQGWQTSAMHVETDHYRCVGQHPVPIVGKEGRVLLARSRPAWQLLLLGTALLSH